MNDDSITCLEERLLILAPIGKDAVLAAAKFAAAGIECHVCRCLSDLAKELRLGACGVLVAEEALTQGAEPIRSIVADQPPWSDLPILVLTRPGAESETVVHALRTLGNVTLLERPIRVATLLSSARTALRARRRQYESRAQLVSLEEADRRKDEFLATLAHELRNPLAPIRNAVELLRRRSSMAAGSDQLADMISRQVALMVRLVDDLLEISRITRGAVELRMSRTTLSSVLDSAIETSRPFIDAGNHSLTIEAPSGDVWVNADPARLAQVFSNLLNNAAKYSDREGRISVTVDLQDDDVEIRFLDSGFGIDPSLLPRVFEMFAQGELSRSRSPGGLGIGLTLARSLVEMHGGRVYAQSKGLGKGSVFVVRLPRYAQSIDETPEGDIAEVDGASTSLQVLIVDDNADAADSLGFLLEAMGASVVVVHDGISALAAIEDRLPDIAFLDLGMPQMDGYELARRIRERRDAERLFLVALTGWGQDRDRSRAVDKGFDQHLVKPAGLQELEAVLHMAAPGSRDTDEP